MIIRYVVDPEHSRLTVQAFAAGMLAGFAHNPVFAAEDFHGELRFAPDSPDASNFELTVRADSLRLTDSVKEQDRKDISAAMRNDVLEVSKFLEIAFASTSVASMKISDNWFRLKIEGNMRLHGVARLLPVDAQLRLTENDMRMSGEFALSMAAFRLKRVSALGGMIELKDELKFTFDLVGHPQQETQP